MEVRTFRGLISGNYKKRGLMETVKRFGVTALRKLKSIFSERNRREVVSKRHLPQRTRRRRRRYGRRRPLRRRRRRRRRGRKVKWSRRVRKQKKLLQLTGKVALTKQTKKVRKKVNAWNSKLMASWDWKAFVKYGSKLSVMIFFPSARR